MPESLTEQQNKNPASERMVTGNAISHDWLNMQVDKANMYIAPLLICTGAEDRDGEITDPAGILDSEFMKSPVVYYNHSHRTNPDLPPVGTAETPDRKYDCFMRDGAWYSGCRFSQASKLGSQTFALVVDGVIRGRSIGGLTHDMEYYRPKAPGVAFHKGQIVKVRDKSISRTLVEMVEWSWTPIQSNRDVVTLVKSVLSRGKIDGFSIDPTLQQSLSGMDLREPASSTKNMRRTPHRLQSRLFTKGVNGMPEVPVAIRFSTKNFTPKTALQTLQQYADLTGDINVTALEAEDVGGAMFIRSTQLIHSGDVEIKERAEAPGVQFLFAKGFFDKSPPTKEQKPDPAQGGQQQPPAQGGQQTAQGGQQQESDIVNRIVADAGKDAVVVQEGGHQAPAQGGQQAPAQGGQQQPPADTVPGAEANKSPTGAQFYQAMQTYLSSGADMGEAGMAELEPELIEKCGPMIAKMRALADEAMAAYNDRYSGNKPAAGGAPADGTGPVEGEESETETDTETDTETEEEEEPTSKMGKSALADLWYGRRHRLPAGFMQQIRKAASELDTDKESAKNRLQMVTKGFVAPKVTVSKSTELAKLKKQIQDELQERELFERRRRLLANR